MSDEEGVDAELLKALKVLRGHKEKKKDVDTEAVSKAIVSAIENQGKDSAAQNAQLLSAINEQNELLEKLTALLNKKQEEKPKTTVVVVNKDPTQSIAAGDAAQDKQVVAALHAADSIAPSPAPAAKSPSKKKSWADIPTTTVDEPEAVASPRSVAVAAAVTQPAKEAPRKKSTSTGPWTFVETEFALKRRTRIESKGRSEDPALSLEDALFGKAEDGNVLQGDSFGKYWERMRNRVDQYGKLKAPKWSILDKKSSVRSYLPKVCINGESQVKLNTGTYYLTVKYENNFITDSEDAAKEIEAAIIIGEIAFDNRGFVLAPGADWNKLFGGQKQMEAPTTSGKAGKLKWHSSKVSEPWKSGDTIKFKIDTNTMTLGFTIQGENESEVRTGWMFKNVLAFTNNKTYADVLHIFAYIGGNDKNSTGQINPSSFVKFSLT